MDFFVARISRVRSAETSTLFRSLDDEDKATIVSLTHVQTHDRAHLRFFPKRFQKAVKQIIRFVLFFFESVHTNCVQTQLPKPRRPNLVPGAPSAHRPLIESPRRAVRVPLVSGSRSAERSEGSLDARAHRGSVNRRWTHGGRVVCFVCAFVTIWQSSPCPLFYLFSEPRRGGTVEETELSRPLP